MDTHFVVKSIVRHPKQNKYLLLTRNLSSSNRPGDFDIPGGKVEKGEILEEALGREIKEETGLTVTKITPIFINSNYDKEKDKYYVFIGYFAHAENDNVILNGKEHSNFKWVQLDELSDHSSEHVLIQKTIAALVKEKSDKLI